MTHSLHRTGTEGDLKKDYVLLAMLARGINDKNPESREKLIQVGEIFKKHDPVMIMQERLWTISPVITATYDDVGNVKDALKDLKKKNLGISIVVSGLIEDIKENIREIGLQMHTVNLSLGVFGNTSKLPEDRVLEITTMCGHHCVSPAMVIDLIEKVKIGKMTMELAAETLSKPCVCGIFNKKRAIIIFRRILENPF
ncbi:MAG: hypothetical protein ACFFCS_02805 [Candidatus Hodarchaeota archaeon]